MYNSKFCVSKCAMVLLVFLLHSVSGRADTVLGAWQNTASLPKPFCAHTMVTVNDCLYVVGGIQGNAYGNMKSSVFRARIQEDGMLAAWESITPLPQVMGHHSAVAIGNRIYVVAGRSHGSILNNGIMAKPTTYIGLVDEHDNIEKWEEICGFPDDVVYRGALAASDTHLYYAGGFYRRLVYQAHIYPDGSLSEWSRAGNLISSHAYLGLVYYENHLFVIGGNRGYLPHDALDETFSTTIQPDGNIEGWRRCLEMPRPNYGFSLAQKNNTVFIVGGAGPRDDVWCTSVSKTGTFSKWKREGPFPIAVQGGAAVVHKNHIYHAGGRTKLTNGRLTTLKQVYVAKIGILLKDK